MLKFTNSNPDSLEILEARVKEKTEQYTQMLGRKLDLERQFHDETLDAKTRCEIYHELSPMLESFYRLEKSLNKDLQDLQDLQSRLVASMSEDLRESFQNSKSKFR